MFPAIDVYKYKILNNILDASSEGEIKKSLDHAIENLKNYSVNYYSGPILVCKTIKLLRALNPKYFTSDQMENIEFVERILFLMDANGFIGNIKYFMKGYHKY